jgi:hypothetical protein
MANGHFDPQIGDPVWLKCPAGRHTVAGKVMAVVGFGQNTEYAVRYYEPRLGHVTENVPLIDLSRRVHGDTF